MAAAGWYPDPGDPSGPALRWYDGAGWTADVTSGPGTGPSQRWAAPAPLPVGPQQRHGSGGSMATSRKVLFALSQVLAVTPLLVLTLVLLLPGEGSSWLSRERQLEPLLWLLGGVAVGVAVSLGVWLPRRRRLQTQLSSRPGAAASSTGRCGGGWPPARPSSA